MNKQNCVNCRTEINTKDILFIPLCDRCKPWRKMLLDSLVFGGLNKNE